jgi:hypothetical protein
MYEAIADAFPLFGCPKTLYSDFVLEFDEDAKSAEKARKVMARKASEAMARSKSELATSVVALISKRMFASRKAIPPSLQLHQS